MYDSEANQQPRSVRKNPGFKPHTPKLEALFHRCGRRNPGKQIGQDVILRGIPTGSRAYPLVRYSADGVNSGGGVHETLWDRMRHLSKSQ